MVSVLPDSLSLDSKLNGEAIPSSELEECRGFAVYRLRLRFVEIFLRGGNSSEFVLTATGG